LDVSKNTTLKSLTVDNNQLTVLDVSNNTALTSLRCFGNQLTSLDLSKNTALNDSWYCLDIRYNNFNTNALNALFSTLHDNNVERKSMLIGGNPGTSTCDRSIATNKGWIVEN